MKVFIVPTHSKAKHLPLGIHDCPELDSMKKFIPIEDNLIDYFLGFLIFHTYHSTSIGEKTVCCIQQMYWGIRI